MQKLDWIIAILTGMWQGIVIGLLSFGPSFFTLVNTGIGSGRKSATRMALGIFLSEFTVAMIVFFGLSDFFTKPYFQMGFALVASITVLFLGIQSYVTKYNVFLKGLSKPPSGSASFVKGFLVNLMNPFPIMLWIGILAGVSIGYEESGSNDKWLLFVNICSILLTLLSIDLGKVYLSEFLGKKISKKIYFFIQKYFGLILTCIGVYFLYLFWKLLCEHNVVNF